MLIALDAGHGGSDPGAVYNGRREKDDNLKLAMAVGDILKNEGMDVFYTRDNDIYETPFKKATDANNSGADYFVSFHRNSGENSNAASGVQVLIYSEGGEKEHLILWCLNVPICRRCLLKQALSTTIVIMRSSMMNLIR